MLEVINVREKEAEKRKVEEKVKVENTLANASFLSMIIGVLAISIGLFTIYRQVYSKENS